MNRLASLLAIALLAGCAAWAPGGPEAGYGYAAGGRSPGPQGSGSVALTPWTENTDAGGFDLSNAGTVSADAVQAEDLTVTGSVDFTGASSVDFTGTTVTGLETISTQSSAYTPAPGAETINVTGNTTITLPSGGGGPYTIVKADDDADEVTVTGSQLINGSLNYVLNSFGQWIKVVWDGSAWSIGSPLSDAGAGNNNPASLTSLLGYWDLNDDEADNGVFAPDSGIGSPTYKLTSNAWDSNISLQVPAKFSNGVSVGGGYTYITDGAASPTYSVPAFRPTGDFAFSAWVKWSDATVGSNRILVDYYANGFDSSFEHFGAGKGLAIYSPSGTSNIVMRRGIGASNEDTTATSVIAADSNWHHIVCQRTTNTWTIWYDGTQVASSTSSNTPSNPNDHGDQQFFIFSNLQAQGDDPAIWIGRALSTTEIGNIWNGSTGRAIR